MPVLQKDFRSKRSARSIYRCGTLKHSITEDQLVWFRFRFSRGWRKRCFLLIVRRCSFFLLSTLFFHFLVQFFSSPVFGAGLTECYTAGSCGLQCKLLLLNSLLIFSSSLKASQKFCEKRNLTKVEEQLSSHMNCNSEQTSCRYGELCQNTRILFFQFMANILSI